MDMITWEWNSHRIRKTKNTVAPAGRPIMMYDLPELYDSQDYLLPLAVEDINMWKTECSFPSTPCDEDIFELCNLIVNEKNLIKSNHPFDTVIFYISLRNEITSLLNINN